MKFITILAMFFSVSSFASKACLNLRDYDVWTENKQICELIKKDACARAVVKAVKEQILNNQAMEDGVDLPESIEINFLQKIGTDPRSGMETFSVTAEKSIDRLASVKRNSSTCAMKSLYNAAL